MHMFCLQLTHAASCSAPPVLCSCGQHRALLRVTDCVGLLQYRISYKVEQLLATDVDTRTPSEQSSPLQTDVLYLSLSYNQSSWSTEKTIEDPQEMSLSLKVTMLTLLSCANASVVVLTHYVRTRRGAMFSASSAVLMAELLKVGACLLAMFIRRPSTWLSNVYSITLGGLQEWARVAVPAMLYAVQNNLVFFALSNLNSVVFQVTYQLKILTTALFSVLLLQKTLTVTQWLSLMLLFAGVAVTQIKGDHSRHTPTAHHAESMALAAVIGASILSGFASVYFEKILKGGGQSIWERNIQLGIPGALCATVTLLVKDNQYLMDRGFFYGYDSWVWLAILLQSLGGLLVAFVVKVMDNILKTFAMALAILLSCAASFFLFHTGITIQTLVGAHLVIIAMFLYGCDTARFASTRHIVIQTYSRELVDSTSYNDRHTDSLDTSDKAGHQNPTEISETILYKQ